jgi:hypothetical protein
LGGTCQLCSQPACRNNATEAMAPSQQDEPYATMTEGNQIGVL